MSRAPLGGPPAVALRLTLALMLVAPTAAQALPEGAWVVSIGHNRGDPGEALLRYAEKDAKTLVATLGEVGGLEPTRTVQLLGADADSVRRALDQVTERMQAEGGEGTLLVFYSGHADAHALHLGGTHLPMAELTERVEQAPGALRMLIVDACRSGAASRVKGLRPADSFEVKVDNRVRAEGMAIITSSTAGEDSQESDELQASFFSHHLTNGLRGAADKNGDGRVTLAEAYAYAYTQTLRSSGRTLKLQHPTYRFDIKGRGEVVLARLDQARGLLGRLELDDPGVYLVTEGSASGAVAAEVSPPRAEAQLILPPRRYHVQARRPEAYRTYDVEVRAGETTRLAGQPYTTISYDRLVRARGGPRSSVHGVMALGGARGGLLGGESVAGQAVLGYQADLPWFSVGARGRFGVATAEDAVAPRDHEEYGVAVTLERFVDLQPLSLSFGLLIEGTWHRQVFGGERPIDPRSTFGAAFGGLFAVERHLPPSWAPGLALRLEGGPYSGLLQVTEVDQGVATGTAWSTPLTWWTALGVRWRM